MKKSILAFCAVLILYVPLFAQVSTDPAHSFYSYVEKWELMGIINEQPPLRPYPIQLIESILNTVIESENELESETAAGLYEQIFERPYHLAAEGKGGLKHSAEDNLKEIKGLASVEGDYKFPKYAGAGYKIGILGSMGTQNALLPVYTLQPNYMRDPSSIGPIEMYLEMDANFAAGTDKLYFQAGVNHNSFGPFYEDNSVLSPGAKHTANFGFVYNPGKFSYSQGLLGLTASNNSEDLYSEKFLSIHSLNGQLLEWLTASFYEVTVYGGRFEPAYLIPVPYMVTQGLSGFDDNILMGLSFTVKPVKNFAWVNDFFIDDLGVNDLIKLNFDTKIRGTFQTAVKYQPPVNGFGIVKLGYTLVTPYMYTHKQNVISNVDGTYFTGSQAVINYQQYTTAGYPLGSGLEPNSDRISFSVSYKPVSSLNLTLKGAYIRHSNVNENLPVEEALGYLNSPDGYFNTDGSINNHQHYFAEGNPETPEYLPSAWDHFLFMCQDTKMTTLQASLDVQYTLPKTKIGTFSLELGYLFEYIKNAGVDNPIFNGHGYYKDGKYVAPCTNADVDTALSAWRKNLTDKTNHYITLSAKCVW